MISFAVKARNLGFSSNVFFGCLEKNFISTHFIGERRRIFSTGKCLALSNNNLHTNKNTYKIGNPLNNSHLNIFEKYSFGSMIKPSDRTSSSSTGNKLSSNDDKLSSKDKLKRAVKDYGATVIVFHVTISLMSLGMSYLVISSGVDVESLLERVGFSSSSDIAAGASTFVVAYALHKMFAPVRISITLGSTPFIVRYLRRVGILKPPK